MKEQKRHHTPGHDDKLNPRQLLDVVVIAGSLGFTLFVSLLVGVCIGHYVDSFFSTSPWGLISCSLLGAVAGFWSLFKKVLALNRSPHDGKGIGND